MERQSLLKEIGGEKLQYLIDRTADRFRPILWPNFFGWKNTTSISYETIIGDAANAAAASVVSYDVAAPLRTRKSIRKLTGEIPSIRQKFRMTEKDMQEYLAMSTGINADAKAILNLIYADVKNCAEAPHKRLDLMVLEALSTGAITLSTTNNPDGMVTEEAVDFGMPAANKETVSVVWSATDKSTVLPITDIMAVVEEAADQGIVLDRMFMRRSVFNYMKLADETKDYVTGWKIGANQNQVNLNLETMNNFMAAEGLPRIVIINTSIDVEKDGVTSAINAWDADNILFTPAGGMGDMLNAPIIERIFPAKHVTYAENNRVLIKKWSETDPVHEYTACELNAFPSWKNVDKCFIMDTEATS
jgi:hypothetical protein